MLLQFCTNTNYFLNSISVLHTEIKISFIMNPKAFLLLNIQKSETTFTTSAKVFFTVLHSKIENYLHNEHKIYFFNTLHSKMKKMHFHNGCKIFLWLIYSQKPKITLITSAKVYFYYFTFKTKNYIHNYRKSFFLRFSTLRPLKFGGKAQFFYYSLDNYRLFSTSRYFESYKQILLCGLRLHLFFTTAQ